MIDMPAIMADIRLNRRHYLGALLIGIAAAFLLGGYEFIRSPTNTLFKTTYGKEHLPLVIGLIPFSVMASVYIYGRILSKLGPRRTLLATSIGSAVLIALGQVAFQRGFNPAIVALYQIREVYVVLLIEQYWSFLNSTLADTQARRLNGPICGLASLGAIAAGTIGVNFTEFIGTSQLILLAAALTVPAAFIADLAMRYVGEPAAPQSKSQNTDGTEAAKPVHGHLALGLFRSERILIVIFAIIVLTQVISAVLTLVYEGMLQDYLPDPDAQTAYSFGIFRTINIAAAVLQFVVTPVLLSVSRLKMVHVVVPIIHVIAGLIFLQSPTLSTAAFAYIAFKALDYSVFRAAKEILYIPLSFDARYRAKEVIDVFGYRFSKGGTALSVTLMQQAGMAFSEGLYATIGLAAAATWSLLTIPLMRQYNRSRQADKEKLP